MTASEFLDKLGTVFLNPLILLMFAVSLVVFLWGVFEYIKDGDNEKDREKGKSNIVWGIIGMFVMVSVYGILEILVNTFLK
jgi:uncharacterized membrane protein